MRDATVTRLLHRRDPQRGFSLLETMVAVSVLLVGLLGVAQVFYVGLIHASTSSAHLVAREKAREAIESVHTARDSDTVNWAQIRNVNAPACADVAAAPPLPAVDFTATGGGLFLNGEQALLLAGPDGLVNTADDSDPEELPGPNGVFEAAAPTDDIELTDFFRDIEICDVNDDLRQIAVTIRYRVGQVERTYTLTSYISSFS